MTRLLSTSVYRGTEKSILTPSLLHVFTAAGAALALHSSTPLAPRNKVDLPVFVSNSGFWTVNNRKQHKYFYDMTNYRLLLLLLENCASCGMVKCL